MIEAVRDNRSDSTDAGVKEWNANHKEAVELGMCSCCLFAEKTDIQESSEHQTTSSTERSSGVKIVFTW